jgi:folate-binding protein YgfZ
VSTNERTAVDTVEPDANQSVLLEAQRRLGADFRLYGNWLMASRFQEPANEHLAVRHSVGLIDLSNYGSMKIWGSEAVQFLNGLVSNDVKTLASGKGMHAAFLTGHGKIRALCRVLNLGNEFLVINDPQTHQKVFKYVWPFSHAGDFKVEDTSDAYRTLSVQGPKAHLVMKEVCFEPVPELLEYDWFSTLIAGHKATVVRSSRSGDRGFDVLVPKEALNDVWDFILLKGGFHSIVPFGLDALESLRIEAGTPIYGVDLDETNMLLEAGFDDAVSFTKGCYTGQEAVAMATYRGHVSKKLSGLAVSGDIVPDHGDAVEKDGKEIGTITSSLRSPSLDSVIALAHIKYGFFDIGNEVQVVNNGERVAASIVELPFHRPS